MKRQLWIALLPSLGAVLGLALPSSVQAQVERELFLISYPDAKIDVDGNASDWNLAQFGSFIVGGVVGGEEPWERMTGTSDIARLGWDDGTRICFTPGIGPVPCYPSHRQIPQSRSTHETMRPISTSW